VRRRPRGTAADVPAELAVFDLERWASTDDGAAPAWWQDDSVTGPYAEFMARRRWQEARRLWVRAQPDHDAAIEALHPSWTERRIVTAMYGDPS
jgi:hypothetical protein